MPEVKLMDRYYPAIRLVMLGIALALPGTPLAAGAVQGQGQQISVTGSWVRAAPPSATVRAAYFTLTNPGPTDVRLVGARSKFAKAVEIHTMEASDGQMRMRREDAVTVPAAGLVRFKTGGRHLMLFGLQTNQDVVPIELLFGDGSTRAFTFPIRPAGAAQTDGDPTTTSNARTRP